MFRIRPSSIEIVHYRQTVCELPSVSLVKRYKTFTEKLAGTPVYLFSYAVQVSVFFLCFSLPLR